jgi:gamma-glutamyl:cysteine ligase YbdK (ATP-grasp superfamily)
MNDHKETGGGIFTPRTFSTDWEVMVVDRLERCVDNQKLNAFAGVLRTEFDVPINTDWNALEFAVGINRSLDEIWGRIQRLTDRAGQLLSEFDLSLFPAGAHPLAGVYFASHVHVGTLSDEAAGIRLENRMVRYVPCFAALAANTPYANHQRGDFKSYRIRYQAHGCIQPSSLRDPRMAQPTWGSDTGPKLYGAPTYEVRILDCASSRRLLAEMATFVAAFTHHQGTLGDAPLTPDEYRDAMTNRWTAARDGMQATFHWKGVLRPVTDILDEMLDEAGDALAALGATRADLSLIEAMLRKRTCQADYARMLTERYPDPYLLASAYAKLMRHWDVFDEYLLNKAPTLDPIPAPDVKAVADVHLSLIGEGTHFYRSREAMSYPPTVADDIIADLIARGDLIREELPYQGTVLSRPAPPRLPESEPTK